MLRSFTIGILCWASIDGSNVAVAGDWPAFRGPAGDGVSTETGVPLAWSAENVLWTAPLPFRGNSSPIVSRGRVFVTCSTNRFGTRRGLFCFDRRDGRQLWSRFVEFEDAEPTHDDNPYCTPTPAADGERVVVWHGSAGLHCYGYDGTPVWSRDLGPFRHLWGHAASPIFHGEAVILNCGPGKRTFVTAIDRCTGETIWQTDEPGGDDGINRPAETANMLGSWSTPVVAHVDDRDQIVVGLPFHVQAYDPDDGRVIWSCRGLGNVVCGSVLVGDGVGAAFGGFFGPSLGFRLTGEGDISDSSRLWHVTKSSPQRVATGVIVNGSIYVASTAGVECLDLHTGAKRWYQRLRGKANKIWSSLIAAEGRVYVTDQDGTTFVFSADPSKFELLATNGGGGPTNSTLAISNGQIFMRTFTHLICIAGD
jgi:outer membrane protein assembly factor BamB